jgi:hypothetical protein
VLRGGVAIREQPRRLEHEVDAERLPRQLRGILDREHLELVAVDGDPIPRGLDARLEVSQNRIVFEQVGEGLGVGQVVDGHDVDRLVADRGAHDVPADPAEPVDAYFDGHSQFSPLQ